MTGMSLRAQRGGLEMENPALEGDPAPASGIEDTPAETTAWALSVASVISPSPTHLALRHRSVLQDVLQVRAHHESRPPAGGTDGRRARASQAVRDAFRA